MKQKWNSEDSGQRGFAGKISAIRFVLSKDSTTYKETGEKIWVSQYEGSQIEKVGMLKMEFLETQLQT